MNDQNRRKNIVVSGYYGFDNLGDEAILEELLAELSRLVPRQDIVVLSQNPDKTSSVFSVKSINRWKLPLIASYLKNARLFVSGGGGLYQDASSIRSVVYYAGLAALARLSGAPSLIYAQGIGPLSSRQSRLLTRLAMKMADAVTVRDSDSSKLLSSWGIASRITADPVWCLSPAQLPVSFSSLRELLGAGDSTGKPLLVGLSLRESPSIDLQTVDLFARAMVDCFRSSMPGQNAVLVPLPLQEKQDRELLDAFCRVWMEAGLPVKEVDLLPLVRPSQWLSFLGTFDLMVGMRFHALLMALKSGVPCLGLAYDPKVRYLMESFEQPYLDLAGASKSKEALKNEITNLIDDFLGRMGVLAEKARRMSAVAEQSACQNFDFLARMLDERTASHQP